MFKNRTFLLGLSLIFWLLGTLSAWQGLLSDLAIIRFALGVVIYLFPGILTFHVLVADKDVTIKSILGGLMVSVFVTGILGVVARSLELNFTFLRWAFVVWGIAILLYYYFQNVGFVVRLEKVEWWEAGLLVIAAGGAVYFSSIAKPPLIHDDAFTYNALLYYFQHAQTLNFDFPDALNRLEIPRFWIAYWPLVEAMISGFSGVDGLLVTGALLPPLLAVFSFLGVYTLARTLGLPRIFAGTAVLGQGFSLMRLSRQNQPGNLFFQRLTEDKVAAAFVLSFTLLILAVEYFNDPVNRKLFLVWLAAWAMAFTHPVQFGMTCMIIGVYGMPSLFKRELRLKYFFVIGVLVTVVIVPYLFRFGGGEYAQSLSFSLNDVAANDEFARFGVRRVDIIEGTPFYGISHYLAAGLPYEVGLVAALASLLFFWKNTTARYILASALVLGVAMFPYTGWLVGMFTTPFQLWRLTWLTPFGIAFAFLLWLGLETAQKVKLPPKLKSLLPPFYGIGMYLGLIAMVVYVSDWTLNNVEKSNTDVLSFYSNYISAAEKINAIDVEETPIILGGPDESTNSVIPSLTMKFEPMVFRVDIGNEKTRLWRSLVADDISPDMRFASLKENNVEYLFLKSEPEWVMALRDAFPENVEFLFRVERFSLYKIKY